MIVGETVILERRIEGEPDAMGDPSFDVVTEDIENVLVSPGATDNLQATVRPDGTVVDYKLHIPKGYEDYTFRGCRFNVRGEWMDVVGNPTYYIQENTPGNWNYPVEVKRCDG